MYKEEELYMEYKKLAKELREIAEAYPEKKKRERKQKILNDILVECNERAHLGKLQFLGGYRDIMSKNGLDVRKYRDVTEFEDILLGLEEQGFIVYTRDQFVDRDIPTFRLSWGVGQ